MSGVTRQAKEQSEEVNDMNRASRPYGPSSLRVPSTVYILRTWPPAVGRTLRVSGHEEDGWMG